MPRSGRPPSPHTQAARDMRDEVVAYMRARRVEVNDLARSAGVSAASLRRILGDQKAKERPALQKVHEFISGTPENQRATLSVALGRVAQRVGGREAATAADILRAVADLLDQTTPSRVAKR